MSVVQLQVKSSYTLLESPIRIPDLIAKAKSLRYTAVALCDHNVMSGAIEFYTEAKRQNVKPIIGLTLDTEGIYTTSRVQPLILLAKNHKGYQALMRLSTDQRRSKKAVSLQKIKEYAADLVIILPSEKSELYPLYIAKKYKDVAHVIDQFQEHFSEAYIGVQANKTIDYYQMLQSTSAKLVALGDVQYLETQDKLALQTLKAIHSGEVLSEYTEDKEACSFLSIDRFTELFKRYSLEEALEQTTIIAQCIDLVIPLEQSLLPKYQVPGTMTAKDYLRQLAEEGIRRKIKEVSSNYTERLDKELRVIDQMGFNDYFLIIWDVMNYAHTQHIETGFGRGSAAASLVAYALDITNIDPIKYQLLFERFLNPQRQTMPDIDLDFPDHKRDIILAYIHQLYGDDHVAQLSTFSTFGAKSAVRDTLRVFGAENQEMKIWSKAIPTTQHKITLNEAYQQSKTLQQLVQQSKRNKHIFNVAQTIEGLPRNVSTHAAGVVMTDCPLLHHVPLQSGGGELLTTQYTMEDTEQIGLLKMDFLGLKNLTILADCFRYVRYETNQRVTKSSIPFDDRATLALFSAGDTNGIFQFESKGIQRVLQKMRPSSFEDIVATNALYRPGPMQQIDHFISRKYGVEAIYYPHEDLESILGITYGVMVYQEQVMQVATQMAGYSLSEADQLRRTMSKKIQSEMDKGRQQFVEGALTQGYKQETAEGIYDYIERFANYGFNRAHAVAYSMVSYQLAYFKVHYPASFFTAILNTEFRNSTKMDMYRIELQRRSIGVLGPDINQSLAGFTVYGKHIRMGFKSIKGVPKAFIEEILFKRQQVGRFKNLMHFIEHIDPKWRVVERIQPIIEVGAFDQFDVNRPTLLEALDRIIQSVRLSGQNMTLLSVTKPRIDTITDWTEDEKLLREKELTGFYLSGHPIEKYTPLRQVMTIDYIAEIPKKQATYVLGKIIDIRTIQTKKGLPMSFVTIADETETLTAILFPKKHRQFIKLINQGDVVVVDGKTESNDRSPDQSNLIVDRLYQADVFMHQMTHKLFLRFQSLTSQVKLFNKVKQLLKRDIGVCPVYIYDAEHKETKCLSLNYRYNLNREVLSQLEQLLGAEHVVLTEGNAS